MILLLLATFLKLSSPEYNNNIHVKFTNDDNNIVFQDGLSYYVVVVLQFSDYLIMLSLLHAHFR